MTLRTERRQHDRRVRRTLAAEATDEARPPTALGLVLNRATRRALQFSRITIIDSATWRQR